MAKSSGTVLTSDVIQEAVFQQEELNEEAGDCDTAKNTPLATQLRPVTLITRTRHQLKKLTGYTVDSIVSFSKKESGWSLTATIIELKRIPASSDVLVEYEVDLDGTGDIVGYRRGRRFCRGEVGDFE